MWWKIYFWVYIVIIPLYILIVFLDTPNGFSLFVTWKDMVLGILGILVLRSYVYKKRIFDPGTWKVIFYITVMDLVFFFLFLNIPELRNNGLMTFLYDDGSVGSFSLVVQLISLPVILPLFYANYKLAFPAEKKKK